ncbi:MAG: ABC transporter substrate-binding protein [Corynebacterium flavescens]|nr:ABC transporter substrate-binding protein [Corynebacterium flavescens]
MRLNSLSSRTAIVAALGALALSLTACGTSSDPLATDEGASGQDPDTIVVGSQAYYSNEILAEIYAQALEADGHKVERKLNIGQRDAYMPALESGEVEVFPEYTGNLLQYLDPQTQAKSPEEVTAALQGALPDSLRALDPAQATDQDSYNVTADFAAEHGLSSVEDLAGLDVPITLGGPAELEKRPYGPIGLKDVYGVDSTFEATGDTTVPDLVAGTVNVANVFSADPRISTDNLVTLKDPKNLFLASQVVPLVSSSVSEEVAPVLNAVSAQLSAEDLVALNVQSTVDQRSSADIARQWLQAHNLA